MKKTVYMRLDGSFWKSMAGLHVSKGVDTMMYIEWWDSVYREWKLSKMIFWKAILCVLLNEDCHFAKVVYD